MADGRRQRTSTRGLHGATDAARAQRSHVRIDYSHDLTGGAELERLSIDTSFGGVPRNTGHVLLRLSALGAKVSYLELKEGLRKTFRSTPPTQEEYESSLIESMSCARPA